MKMSRGKKKQARFWSTGMRPKLNNKIIKTTGGLE
jgi:hypothetical protein